MGNQHAGVYDFRDEDDDFVYLARWHGSYWSGYLGFKDGQRSFSYGDSFYTMATNSDRDKSGVTLLGVNFDRRGGKNIGPKGEHGWCSNRSSKVSWTKETVYGFLREAAAQWRDLNCC